MIWQVYTDVVTEPVTLAEVKAHLRLDSGSLADDISSLISLAPKSRAAASFNGDGVDVLGKTAIVNLSAGENQATGTVDVHIEESDDDITYTDWSGGTFDQITTSNDNAMYEIQYTGSKQYIRAVAVVASANCEFGVSVIVFDGETAEDTLLESFITAAREHGEDVSRRAFATQTIDVYLNDFPACDRFDLPMPPVQTITSLSYTNSDGDSTTMTVDTEYIADITTEPAQIVLPYGVPWPSFTAYPVNAIKCRYVTGYTTLPKTFKQAMLLHIGYMYKYRDSEIPTECMATINRMYRRRKAWWF